MNLTKERITDFYNELLLLCIKHKVIPIGNCYSSITLVDGDSDWATFDELSDIAIDTHHCEQLKRSGRQALALIKNEN
jgi:hypothetical protein